MQTLLNVTKKLVTFKSVYMAYLKNQLDHFQLEFLASKPILFYKEIVQKIKIMQFSIRPVTILNKWIYQECRRHLWLLTTQKMMKVP
jgi:hypothetical protein